MRTSEKDDDATNATSYEQAVQREMVAMARQNAERLVRLRENIEALGGYAGNERDRGYNEAVIDAVALIDRALTEKSDPSASLGAGTQPCDAVGCAEPALDSTADGERFCHDHMLVYVSPTPRFPDVHCSRCGRSFGPGDHGFSHCDQHNVNPSKKGTAMASGEFSVYQFFADESYEEVVRGLDPLTATLKARDLTNSVGAKMGMTRRVIITDGGDFTCFEWKFGEGIVFPPPPDKKG